MTSEQKRRALSEKEVAERYPVSVHWLRRCRWAGNGPPYVQTCEGGKVMYLISDIDNYFTNLTCKPKKKKKKIAVTK
jgi:hypothetical protein